MTTKFKYEKNFQDSTINRVSGISVVAFSLGLFVYAINVNWLPVTIIPSEVTKTIIGIILTYFLSGRYVKPAIENWVNSDIESYKDKIDKESSEILEGQELELLYALQKVFRSVKQLDFHNLNLEKDNPINRSEIDDKVREYGMDKEIRDKTVEELLEADKKQYLQGVAQLAVEKKLNITINDDRYPKLVTPIHAYLRAWLVCSIKYNRYMPVEQILESTANIKDHVKAIKYIKDVVLEAETKEDLIPSHKSREIIQKYLGKLIEKLWEKI